MVKIFPNNTAKIGTNLERLFDVVILPGLSWKCSARSLNPLWKYGSVNQKSRSELRKTTHFWGMAWVDGGAVQQLSSNDDDTLH